MRKRQVRMTKLVVGLMVVAASGWATAADFAVPNACVVVFDATPPSITLQGQPTVTLAVGASYSDAGASALDNMDGDLSSQIAMIGSVDVAHAGSYPITYDVSDSTGNPAVRVTRTVTVTGGPGGNPVIVLRGNAVVTVEVKTAYTDAGATATDPEDGDLTSGIVVNGNVDTSKVGTYYVTYDVMDSGGNAAGQVVRTVKVVDTTPPVITPRPFSG